MRIAPVLRWTGLAAVVAGILVAPSTLQAQQPSPEPREEEPPPFCRTQDDHQRGEKGHPRFGQRWCELEARGLHPEDGPLQVRMDLQVHGAVDPFCRDPSDHPRGGEGHPEFGAAWCQKKQAERERGIQIRPSLLQGAPSGIVRSESFCVSGQGHAEFGMEWCRMTDDQWARFQEERSDRRPPPM